MNKQNRQFRVFEFRAAEVDAAGRIPVVCSTDAVVTVSDGPEILVHEVSAIDMTRAPLPIIVTHGGGQINVGIVEDATISNGQMRGWARFGERPEAIAYARDVMNQIIRSVSVGYQRIKGYIRQDNVLVTTRWMPTHVAMIAEPADAGAGFYRAAAESDTPFELIDNPELPAGHTEQSRSREIAIDSPSAGENTTTVLGERSMTTQVENPAAPTPATRTPDVVITGADPLVAERARVREITAIGRQFNMVELADTHVEGATTVEGFRSLVLEKLKDSGQLRVAETPEIGLTEKEAESFSFSRAILAAMDPANAAKIAPFEMECSRAAQDKRDKSDNRIKERDAGGALTLPVDVLSRGLRVKPEQASAVARALMGHVARGSHEMQAYMRDLNVGSATAGGNLVATELLGSSFIELLRNAMILDRLGVTFLRDLVGNIAIPSHTGAATGYWVSEGNAPTESQQTVGQVPFTPKTVGAFTDFTRRFLLQSSIDAELFVRMDLARVLGLAIQNGAFNGSGSNNEPTGLFAMTGLGSVAMGDNGGAPTYDMWVDLESAVANANADVGNQAFVTNTKVRGKSRKTQEFASTNGKPVWTSGRERGIGEVLGYDAHVTNTIPSNLVKGTSGAVCSAAAFGNWADFVVALWGGLDIMLDPYALATSGGKRVIALQDVDVNVRHLASFATVEDILTT